MILLIKMYIINKIINKILFKYIFYFKLVNKIEMNNKKRKLNNDNNTQQPKVVKINNMGNDMDIDDNLTKKNVSIYFILTKYLC